MALSNFGEQFSAKVLERMYQKAVTPSITNDNYEGEIKKPGDRVNILSFLTDIPLEDYVAGTDMTVYSPVDTEDQLVVEKRKSWDISIDRLEELFSYAQDIPEQLIDNASKVLERNVDSYVLERAKEAKVGSWVGTNFRVVGSSRDTEASIATTSTGGTITVGMPVGIASNYIGATENPADGNTYFAGFTAVDIDRPIRLTSGSTHATEWYRITAVTDSLTVSVTNWDGATSANGGGEIPNGDILRGLGGAYEITGSYNGDGKPTTEGGWGWEIQAAIGTTIGSASVFEQITLLEEALNKNEIPEDMRHITGPPQFKTALLQASELQPSGVEKIYSSTVENGLVARVSGFDVHVASGVRVSTRANHSTASGVGADTSLTTGAQQYQILANHLSFCTFAYKWAENRTVEAERQFAKLYQGLHLYGSLVPAQRRKAGAMLFGSF